MARLASGQPFDCLCEAAIAGGLGFCLGDPLDVFFLVAVTECLEGNERRLVFAEGAQSCSRALLALRVGGRRSLRLGGASTLLLYSA